ncbi:DUF4275 family protein [Peribacillus saganii]|uniref:DUF4275 family protein n=1 Tax=Peribacillus saganii TaxID=2303992 RepID=A0A372LRK2_9BACI|nr:DUF4275 family protein [Peribacillus saganii]RFU70547.1 DUF4275 family protein [Peribacillus saganii]
MDIEDILKSKKVKVTEIPSWGTYLRKPWELNFANHLSFNDKKSIYLYDQDGACGYLWHLFSYGKKSCKKDEQAQTAFNNEQKDKCYIFYQHSDHALLIENARLFSADDLINEEDVYVVDKEFSWTYVKTHETGWCGPYFSRK